MLDLFLSLALYVLEYRRPLGIPELPVKHSNNELEGHILTQLVNCTPSHTAAFLSSAEKSLKEMQIRPLFWLKCMLKVSVVTVVSSSQNIRTWTSTRDAAVCSDAVKLASAVVTMYHLQQRLELRGVENKRQNASFLQYLLCRELCNVPTVRNTHTQLFYSEDEPEKREARGRRMSLNVWVKLMDCFLPLRPWPLLLPRSSQTQTTLPLILPHPPSQIFTLLFLVQESLFTSPPQVTEEQQRDHAAAGWAYRKIGSI